VGGKGSCVAHPAADNSVSCGNKQHASAASRTEWLADALARASLVCTAGQRRQQWLTCPGAHGMWRGRALGLSQCVPWPQQHPSGSIAHRGLPPLQVLAAASHEYLQSTSTNSLMGCIYFSVCSCPTITDVAGHPRMTDVWRM
jgi:hypothetical protein